MKQTIVSHSITKVEYRIACTSFELVWLCWLLKDMGVFTPSLFIFIATTKVKSRLLAILYFMNGLSILRLVAILFPNITNGYNFSLSCFF